MNTFCELYCARHRCPPNRFANRVFWRSLYPHARLFAPVVLLVNKDYFAADRFLIGSVATALSMSRVRDEVRDFYWDANNQGWWRRSFNLRISGQRLKELAREYLPEGNSIPPFPPPRSAEDSASPLPPRHQ